MDQVLSVGLDVHKESIVAATDTEAQLYGTIGGTLAALDSLKTDF